MDAARTELRVATFVAVLVIIADIIEWCEFIAVHMFLGGLHSIGRIEDLLAIDEPGGNSKSGEKTLGLPQIEMAAKDGLVDAGNRELDGSRILGSGQAQWPDLTSTSTVRVLEW